jgi:hypothetical protein
MPKLAVFCIFNLNIPLLDGHLSIKIAFKIETSAQNMKIAELAYFADLPA